MRDDELADGRRLEVRGPRGAQGVRVRGRAGGRGAVADEELDEPEALGLLVAEDRAAGVVPDVVGEDVLAEDDVGGREVRAHRRGVVVRRGGAGVGLRGLARR